MLGTCGPGVLRKGDTHQDDPICSILHGRQRESGLILVLELVMYGHSPIFGNHVLTSMRSSTVDALRGNRRKLVDVRSNPRARERNDDVTACAQ